MRSEASVLYTGLQRSGHCDMEKMMTRRMKKVKHSMPAAQNVEGENGDFLI